MASTENIIGTPAGHMHDRAGEWHAAETTGGQGDGLRRLCVRCHFSESLYIPLHNLRARARAHTQLLLPLNTPGTAEGGVSKKGLTNFYA